MGMMTEQFARVPNSTIGNAHPVMESTESKKPLAWMRNLSKALLPERYSGFFETDRCIEECLRSLISLRRSAGKLLRI
jgi:hypothetical protein